MLQETRRLTRSSTGRLKLWHAERYKPFQGVAYGDRSYGSLLREFYLVVAQAAEELRRRAADLDPSELEKLADLEEVLEPDERAVLRGLSEEASLEAWATEHKISGDPLAAYWEYRASRDLPVDLDMEIKNIPPRDRWGEENP